ncbi:MAG: hypothetical protein MZW92_02775 [Comamonadaceae bacterium]|nr:hypothetical protein [Comamonadaceae bacterium]
MIAQMTRHLPHAQGFRRRWSYLSMLLQAEGIRYGVEHWRRNRDRVMRRALSGS